MRQTPWQSPLLFPSEEGWLAASPVPKPKAKNQKQKQTQRQRQPPPASGVPLLGRGIKARPAGCASSGGVSQQKPASSVGRQHRCRAEATTYRPCGRHRSSHRFYSPLSAGGDGAARRGSGWRHRQTQKKAPDGATPASALREIQCHAPHKGIHFEQTLKQFAMCACPNKREAPSFKRPLLVIDK